jgi:hypothetical protein
MAQSAAEQGKAIVSIFASMIKSHSGLEYYIDDNGILQVDQIDEALNDLKRRCEERVNDCRVLSQPIALALSRNQKSDLPRNDLSSGIRIFNGRALGQQDGLSFMKMPSLGDGAGRKERDQRRTTRIPTCSA